MAGAIKFDGIGSGIPTDEMLTKLVEAEKFQAKKLQKWKSEWEEKVEVLGEINKKVNSVTTSLNTLADEKLFYSKVANSNNNLIADVASDSTSTNGTYNLEIAVKTKHIIASKGFADVDTAPVSTNDISSPELFSFNDGSGNNISINIDNTMNLSELRDQINNEAQSVGSNSKAFIINDGTDNGYRLKITGDSAGEAHKIEVLNSNSILSLNSNSIDSVEKANFSGTTTIDAIGSYSGHVNKRLQFEVQKGGTLGTDDIKIKWIDNIENKNGVITINASTFTNSTDYLIEQGVNLNFSDGTLTKGDSFSLDLFNPTVQQAQDSGLAKTEKEVHSGFVDADSTAVTQNSVGTFSYSYAGEAITPIQVPKGTTLNDLAKIINNDGANPGVVATVINDGTGLANSFHLILTAKNAGSANKIENITHTLDNFSSTFDEFQKGQNAMYKLNDYPKNHDYLQSDSNLISDAIKGVSINLKSEGSVNLTIENDIDEMTNKVQNFIDSYNEAIDYLNEITKVVVDNEGKAKFGSSGILTGNYGVNMLKSDLQLFITKRPIGFEDGSDPYLLLGQFGIKTEDNSKLTFDQDILKKQLRENPEEVVSYFSADKEGEVDSSYIKYLSGTGLTKAGNYEIEVNYKTDGSGDVDNARYRKKDSKQWYNMAVGKNNILTAMKGDAIGTAVSVIWNGSSSSITTNFRIKEGKAHQFINRMDEILDDKKGITKVLINNYEDIIKNIDKKITNELKRVSMVEARYRDKFARLEKVMSESSAQQQQIARQLGSLPTSTK